MNAYQALLSVMKIRFTCLLFLALLGSGLLHGQRRRLQNQPKYDEKPIHFGFSVGMNTYDFKIDPIPNLDTLNGYFNVESVTEPGYSIAIISNLRLGHYFDLRFNPGFSSTVRRLRFDIIDPNTGENVTERREIESSFLEFPLELKFKSQRVNNYRLYVTGAAMYSLDLSSDEDIEDDRVFKLARNDYSYVLGFGVDIYFEYFKFSPQIKAQFGLSDVSVDDDTFLVEGLQRVQTRAILINFTFE